MSTLKTNNLEHLDASSPNITLGIGGGVNISGITTSEQIRVGADNNGTNIYGNSQGIGIGIQTPTQELEVNGAIVARGQANAYSTDGLYIQNKGLGIFDISAWRDGASVSIITFSTDEGLDAAPVERMRLTQTGNLGIGTDSPEAKLEIFGGVTKSGGGEEVLRVESSDAANIPAVITQGQSDSTLSILSGGLNTGSRRGGQIDFIAGDASSNAGTLIFRAGTGDGGTPQTERMRVDFNGNIGIGTTSPTGKLHIQRDSSNMIRCTNSQSFGQSDITLIGSRNDNGECGSVRFLNHRLASDPNDGAEIFASVAGVSASNDVTGTNRGGDLAFSTRDTGDGDVLTERARILASGGLTFNGDTADSNALDDYEEGTWTPGFEGGTTAGSYTFTGTGRYTKVGNKVTVWGQLTNLVTVSAGSGSVLITGLPFSSSSTLDAVGSIILDQWTFGSSQRYGVARVGSNQTRVTPRMIRDGLSDNGLDITDKVNDTADLNFCVTYFV